MLSEKEVGGGRVSGEGFVDLHKDFFRHLFNEIEKCKKECIVLAKGTPRIEIRFKGEVRLLSWSWLRHVCIGQKVRAKITRFF